MPYQALTFEEITSISTHICTTNLPSNIQAGTVSSLIQSWNNINRPSAPRPRSPSLENLTTTIRERRESLAAESEFFDTEPVTNSLEGEIPVSPSPRMESPISTFPRIESYVSTFSRIHSSKIQSPVSTLSKADSPITTLPKKVSPVVSPPEKESRRAMAGERWHGKSWVKRDFVDRRDGGWIRPVGDFKGPLIPPVETVPPEVEARTAETPMAADLWSPGVEEDSRAGLRRLSTRPPTEQRKPLPESWYRSPQHDDDGCSSASTSNAHLEKLKAIGRKHGLDFEPAEDESDCQSAHEQLQHKIHMRNHRRCHRCGEIYDFYNICLRCGHKCCRECPRSPSEKADEESQATTSSCSAHEERKSSSLLPMTHTASSYTDSMGLDGDDGTECEPAYIEALLEDIDNAITTVGGGYESSQRESSQGEGSEGEDSEMIAEVDQKQTMPPGGFPDSPNQSTNSLQEKNVQSQTAVYEESTDSRTEDSLSPDDHNITKELIEDVESSQPSLASSLLPVPQSSRGSCSHGSHSTPTACSEHIRGRTFDRTHSHTKREPRHHHQAIPHHRHEPCCHCCYHHVVNPCHCCREFPPPTAYCDGPSRSSSCRSQNTHANYAYEHHDEASDWDNCSQVTQQQRCQSRHRHCRALCACCPSHYSGGRSRYYKHHYSRASSARPFILALHLTNQYPLPQTPPTQTPTTPVAAATPQPSSAGPNGRWNILTNSLRRIESVDDGIVPAADAPQPRPRQGQQPTPSRVPNHHQQSKSAPMTRRESNEMAQPCTKQKSATATTGDRTPRQTLKQGSVAARARAWEQTAVLGIPTPTTAQNKGKKVIPEVRRGNSGSDVSSLSKQDAKSQKIGDDDSDQARVSLHREIVGPENNRIRVVVEILGDGDGGKGGTQDEATGRRGGKKWVVEVDVDVDMDVELGML